MFMMFGSIQMNLFPSSKKTHGGKKKKKKTHSENVLVF